MLTVVMIFGVKPAQTGADIASSRGSAASSTPAIVIAVTTMEDELNIDGDCCLREAAQAANTDTAVYCPGQGCSSVQNSF